jgi:cytochrome c
MRTAAPVAPSLPVLLLVLGLAATAHAQASPEGKALFMRRCGTCHSIEPGLNMAGPSLAGVVGRKVATVPGAIYSPAMRAHRGVWTAEALDTYLVDPQAVVPGTSMTLALPDAAERKTIIAYLEAASPAKPAAKKKAAR